MNEKADNIDENLTAALVSAVWNRGPQCVWKRLKKAGWQYKNSGLLGARYIAPLGDCSEEYGRDEFTATPEILEGNVPARSEVVNTLRELFFRRGEDGRSMLLGIDTELDDLVNGVANDEQMIEEANERTEEELSPEVRALKHTVDLNNPVVSVLLREDDTMWSVMSFICVVLSDAVGSGLADRSSRGQNKNNMPVHAPAHAWSWSS
jgi:hypothetical protein